jgi:hypothetical protein
VITYAILVGIPFLVCLIPDESGLLSMLCCLFLWLFSIPFAGDYAILLPNGSAIWGMRRHLICKGSKKNNLMESGIGLGKI